MAALFPYKSDGLWRVEIIKDGKVTTVSYKWFIAAVLRYNKEIDR